MTTAFSLVVALATATFAPAQGVTGSASTRGVPPGLTDARFSFSAEELPMKQALALFARANRLNIVPDLDVDGIVTVDFHDLPLDLAMESLLEANGYYFTFERGLIRVRNQETRIFRVDYIHATRAGQGSNAVQISSSSGGGGSASGGGGGGGSSGGSDGSTMTVTNTSTIDFWGGLSEQLEAMISSTGSFTLNSLAGTVLVRDSHRRVETVAQYLDDVVSSVGRQIELEVEIYEVTLGNSSQLGINWARVSDRLDAFFTTMPGLELPPGSPPLPSGVAPLPSGGGLIIENPVYGVQPPLPGIRIGHERGGTMAVLDALKQEGKLNIVSKPRLRTLNNQPAVVRVGQDIPVFMREVTQSASNPPIITETETVQNITVGTVLSITPQVSAEGLITLDLTPAVSRLVRYDLSATGRTRAPVIDIRQASSIVRLRDGDTVVMGGLVQDSATTTRRKVPVLGDVPLLGRAFTGSYENKERTELIFILTPRVVRDRLATPTADLASVTIPVPISDSGVP